MSQLPMMPLFTDALLGDTMHLSAEEFGAYMLILFATWRNNGQALADDDKAMARICRVSIPCWQRKLRPVLIGFFTNSDGCLHQKRLEKEWNHSKDFLEKKSRAGRASALKRWKTGLTEPSSRYSVDNSVDNLPDQQPSGKNVTQNESKRSSVFPEPPNQIAKANPLTRHKPCLTEPLLRHQQTDAHHLHTEKLSAPIQGRESFSVHAVGMPHLHLQASDTSPSPAEAAGAAPLAQEQHDGPSALEDPAVRAEAIAALDRCLDALHGKADTLAADSTPAPPNPRIVTWRQRLNRLNSLVGERLTGNTRDHAWDAIARADAIDDPALLPPSLADDLDAIEALAAEAEP